MVRLDNNRDKLSSSALFFLSRSLSCSRTFFERIKRKKKGKKERSSYLCGGITILMFERMSFNPTTIKQL